jgi:hypothetical protein
MDKDTELEAWSYMKMCMSSHDKDGKIVLEQPKKARKKKCLFGKKIVSSPFFRSIVYHIDHHVETAKAILDYRKRDLEEFNNYVQDEQVDDDPDYRHELAREIIHWMRMLDLYNDIKDNKNLWMKQGKFPWSGIKVSTSYYDAPPVRMASEEPVAGKSDFLRYELTPVSKGKSRKPKRSKV